MTTARCGRAVRRAAFVSLAIGVASAACAPRARDEGQASPPAAAVRPSPRPPEAVVPEPAGSFAPSLARVVGPPASGEALADVEGCAACHSDVAAQWRRSAHAFASFNNPVYRVAVERLRRERDVATSRFCGACHDIALLVDGAMDRPIDPDDVRAHAGVACRVCHSVSGARADGNGSWDLDASPPPVPIDGDAESLLRHRAAVGRPVLRSSALCGSCHRAFLDAQTGNASHLVGQDDLTPWSRSAFAGSHGARIDDAVEERDCRGCHMPRVPAVLGDVAAKNGTIASHAVLGGHTWLAAMQGDAGLVERVRGFLEGRVTIDLAGVRHDDGHADLAASGPVVVRPGEPLVLEVALQNLAVGHRFPGGVMDAQDSWIEVVVEDARGRPVAEAGTLHASSGADPTAHRLASYMARADGGRALERETHEFRAGVYNNTLPPRDATVVGYALPTPAEAARYPLRAVARLRHRSRNLELQRVACAESASERGRAFGRAGLAKVARAIDACRAQPVTDLARTELLLHARAPVASPPALPAEVAFARLFAYGLGLGHSLKERLDDARTPLLAALEIAPTARARAMAEGALAAAFARQMRVEETTTWATRASESARLAGMEPPVAMLRARAEVLASTWRHAEAVGPSLETAARSPRDDGAWSFAAVVLGAAGDSQGALDVVRRGLALQPRDEDLLRVQAIALAELGMERPRVEAAEAAFLDARSPDDAPRIRALCSAKVPGCANERVPVHVHAMRMR